MALIGLNFTDIIHSLRDEDDEDLRIQCDVFEDEKHEDEEELAEITPDNVDITDHQKLFTAIFQKVLMYKMSYRFTNTKTYYFLFCVNALWFNFHAHNKFSTDWN